MFDAVLILERPETHRQLDRWFGKNANEVQMPRKNSNPKKHIRTRLSPLHNFTREEFYRYNALDKELYEFALELSSSLSKSAGTMGNHVLN